jgi:hypothetical protein
VAPGEEYHALAREAYQAGRRFPEIVSMLESRGLSPDLIPDVTTALARDRAFYLFSAGKCLSEVTRLLTERGMSPEDAEAIAGPVARARGKAFGLGKWQTWLLVAGGVLLMADLILYAVGRLGGPRAPAELIAGLLGLGVGSAAIGWWCIAYAAGWRWGE